ncbi:MAG: amino acid adenylation domain-containing protein [bacterium]
MAQDDVNNAGLSEGMKDRIGELSPAKRALLEKLRAKASVAPPTWAPIPKRPAGSGPAPASFAQELLWMLDRAAPGLSAYHAGRVLRLSGKLDTALLQRALDILVARHDALRTTFEASDREPRQIVHPSMTIAIEHVNLRSVQPVDHAAAIRDLFATVSRKPFDMAIEPQLRVVLPELSDDEHYLFLVGHHVALDGWSFDILVRELATTYGALVRGEAPALADIPITFADFAEWQRDQLSGAVLQRLMDYWRTRLDGTPDELPLPTDRPRPARPSFDGGQRTIVLPQDTLEQLRETARKCGATVYTMMAAAYVSLLHRYSGIDDIVIGSPAAGRTRERTEKIVGYFANTLVLRVDCSGNPTFTELVGRVRDTWLGALEHQDIPLEKLVMELRRDRALGPAPLFQCTLTMESPAPGDISTGGDLQVESVELDSGLDGTAKFDLLLLVAERPDGLRALLQYRADLFNGETAERMLGHLDSVLKSVIASPEQRLNDLPLLSPAERADLSAWATGPAMAPTDVTVAALIEGAVDRAPSAIAAKCGDDTISYADLERRANQLAHRLRALGAGPDAPVGLCLPRSVDAIVALVGILKAGSAYVPLAPELPAARLKQQVAEAGATVIVGTEAQRVLFSDPALVLVRLDTDADELAALPAHRVPSQARADDGAYILFTSGSTGMPKGVRVSHRNAVHYTRAVSRVLADVPVGSDGDGISALAGWHFGLASTLAADLGNTSLYASLCGAGTLHVLTDATTTDPSRFADYMAANPLDVMKITPGHLRALAGDRIRDDLAGVLPRKWIVTGGEPLTLEFAERLLGSKGPRVLNHYGPTETTVGCTTLEVTADSLATVKREGAQTVPIGRPLANVRLRVIDKSGHEAPIGVHGELYVGGQGVASGYVNRPDLTEERFTGVGDERSYRTGDVVRWLPSGVVEFLGRADEQVKIRGYRVELGEIQHVLADHPGVAECVVILRAGDDGSDPALVAYVVAKAGGYAAAHAEKPTSEKLLAFASTQLPEYALPSTIMLIDRIPLTANGKLDRAALPSPEVSRAKASNVVPRTDTEAKLADIWKEVLKVERVGVTDDFLKLGGHSLLAIRILGKISRTLGVRLPLRALFDAPTIEQLAPLVEQARQAAGLATTGV